MRVVVETFYDPAPEEDCVGKDMILDYSTDDEQLDIEIAGLKFTIVDTLEFCAAADAIKQLYQDTIQRKIHGYPT